MANLQNGEFVLDSLTLVNSERETTDIGGVAVNLRMYESIYNKFVTGDVSILDGLNLLKNFKFTGQESLTVRMKQKEGVDQTSDSPNSIEKTFRVYKVINIQRPTESTQTYQLKICDPRMFTARTTRISQALRGSYTNILYKILQDPRGVNIKPTEIDKWENTLPANVQFVSPNWSVAKLTDYIVESANTGTDASYKTGMFFYQTLNGGFRFSSIDSMMTREFPLEFSMKSRNTLLQTKDIDINDSSGLNTQILNVSKPQQFDTLQGTIAGAYASSMKVYDPIRKLEEDIVFDLEETFKNGNHISGFPMIRTDGAKKFEEKTLTAGINTGSEMSPESTDFTIHPAPNKAFESLVLYNFNPNHDFDNSNDISSVDTFVGNNNKDNSILERRALLENLQQHRIVITIPLRTDLSVGTIIKLNIPEPELQDGEDNSDKVNDNRYLIIDLCINADPIGNTGVCYLECVKESYAQDIRDANPLGSASAPREI